MEACPWGTNELKRLSVHIRDSTPPGTNHPSYADVMGWYNDLAARVQQEIAGLNWPPLLLDRPFEVSSRAKTIDTLRQKLLRDPSTPLPSVQDIAGVRFEAEMSLDEQDAVVTAICGMYNQDPSTVVRDMRTVDHSGYRAVHIWLRLPARVEVQVRTHLQGLWANTYEAAADVFGRGIRYNELPDDPEERTTIARLRELSTNSIASMERDRNEISTIDLTLGDLVRNGITDIPEEDVRRLDELRARYKGNEERLQTALVQLREFFSTLRDEKR